MRVSVYKLRALIREALRSTSTGHQNIIGQVSGWTLELVDNYQRAVETGYTDPDYFDEEMWNEQDFNPFFYVIARKQPMGGDDDVIIFTPEDGNYETLSGGRISRPVAAEIRPLLAIAKNNYSRTRSR